MDLYLFLESVAVCEPCGRNLQLRLILKKVFRCVAVFHSSIPHPPRPHLSHPSIHLFFHSFTRHAKLLTHNLCFHPLIHLSNHFLIHPSSHPYIIFPSIPFIHHNLTHQNCSSRSFTHSSPTITLLHPSNHPLIRHSPTMTPSVSSCWRRLSTSERRMSRRSAQVR